MFVGLYMNLTPLIVMTITNNTDKIRKNMQQAIGVSVTRVRYSVLKDQIG